MTETPLYFDGPSSRLFGVLHEPAQRRERIPVVFCHPFAEEKLWAHRVFVTFARVLAERGHAVLRFDYMGNGDSEGRFEDTSVHTALADIGAASDLLKARTGQSQLGLLGLRLGATYAALVAEERADIAALMLWAPIVNGSRYMQDLLRINLTTQMAVYREIREDRQALARRLREGATVNIDGYEVSLPLFEELSAVQLRAPQRFGGRCLIVQTERRLPAAPKSELETLTREYNANFEMVEEEPFWQEIARFYQEAPQLSSATLQWMDKA
jgi:uncharacterized protein